MTERSTVNRIFTWKTHPVRGKVHHMKILFLAPEPFFELRGTPINIKHLLEAAGEQGHKIDLLTYHIGKNIHLQNVKIHRIPGIPFIKHVPIGPSRAKIILDCIFLIKSLEMTLTSRYDCIHAVEESVFIAFLLGKLFRIPYIYDMDSCISDQLSYTGKVRNRHILRIVRFLEGLAMRNSAVVLTVCSALTELADKIAPGKKVFQIEDCPVEYPLANMQLSRESFGLKRDNIVVMYTGNFEPYQGVEMLLKSISLLPVSGKDALSVNSQAHHEIKLVLVGGETGQINRLKSFTGKLGIFDSGLFLGKHPMEEIPSLLSLADILVSPRLEGTNTPMKIFDYLASGTPVVATNLPMHTQVLSEKTAVLCEPSPECFADGILRLIRNEKLRKKLGEEGKKLVESKYSQALFRERVAGVYEFVKHSIQQ